MIHYHGLPLTPQKAMIKAFNARHAMVSFERPDQIEHAAEVCQSVVLDNGAFSAWKHKRAYDFTGYLEWASFWIRHPAVEWCIIPDVIDGDEDDNDHLVMTWPLARALSVPVFHMHESLTRLDWLVKGFPRIALGSSGEFKRPGSPKWWRRMDEVMKVVCDSEGIPKVKLHGLRMLDPDCFSRMPLSSADSTNVARNVGIDKRWTGRYVSKSRTVRALILMDRIETHASARRWSGLAFRNRELIG